MELDSIHNEDCEETMWKMGRKYIFADLILTSPPYDDMRNYAEGQEWNFAKFKRIAAHFPNILAEGGRLVWIVNDRCKGYDESGTAFKQALWFKDICGLKLNDTMIFAKRGVPAPNPNSYYQNFEYMFVFSKGKPKTTNIIKDVKNINLGVKYSRHSGYDKHGRREWKENKDIQSVQEYRNRSNIWEYDVGFQTTKIKDIAHNHPAIFPEKLAYDHIISWTNEGDLVYDPFCGSGTTLEQARISNRRYIGSEIVPEFYELALQRVARAEENMLEFKGLPE